MTSQKLNFFKLFLLFTIIPFCANSQSKNDTTENLNDIEDYSFMMINASYTNNNLEYLTGVTEKIPTLFTNLSYINKTGLYSGISYSNYFNAEIQSYEYGLQAGYQKYLNDVLKAVPSHKGAADLLRQIQEYPDK